MSDFIPEWWKGIDELENDIECGIS